MELHVVRASSSQTVKALQYRYLPPDRDTPSGCRAMRRAPYRNNWFPVPG